MCWDYVFYRKHLLSGKLSLRRYAGHTCQDGLGGMPKHAPRRFRHLIALKANTEYRYRKYDSSCSRRVLLGNRNESRWPSRHLLRTLPPHANGNRGVYCVNAVLCRSVLRASLATSLSGSGVLVVMKGVCVWTYLPPGSIRAGARDLVELLCVKIIFFYAWWNSDQCAPCRTGMSGDEAYSCSI